MSNFETLSSDDLIKACGGDGASVTGAMQPMRCILGSDGDKVRAMETMGNVAGAFNPLAGAAVHAAKRAMVNQMMSPEPAAPTRMPRLGSGGASLGGSIGAAGAAALGK